MGKSIRNGEETVPSNPSSGAYTFMNSIRSTFQRSRSKSSPSFSYKQPPMTYGKSNKKNNDNNSTSRRDLHHITNVSSKDRDRNQKKGKKRFETSFEQPPSAYGISNNNSNETQSSTIDLNGKHGSSPQPQPPPYSRKSAILSSNKKNSSPAARTVSSVNKNSVQRNKESLHDRNSIFTNSSNSHESLPTPSTATTKIVKSSLEHNSVPKQQIPKSSSQNPSSKRRPTLSRKLKGKDTIKATNQKKEDTISSIVGEEKRRQSSFQCHSSMQKQKETQKDESNICVIDLCTSDHDEDDEDGKNKKPKMKQ